MEKQVLHHLPVWNFPRLKRAGHFNHFITTRTGGCSSGIASSLNLGFIDNDNEECVKKNREILCEAIRVPYQKLLFPQQCHSANIAEVTSETSQEEIAETDAIITKEEGIAIGVLTADCVPIILYDPVHHAAGVIHSGWRGTVQHLPDLTIQAMKNHFGTDPSTLLAGIGPSIGPAAFEVGEEVVEAFQRAFPRCNRFIYSGDEPEKAKIDLWHANKELLQEEGVLPGNIETSGLCTWTYDAEFYSARKHGEETGRFATGLVLYPTEDKVS